MSDIKHAFVSLRDAKRDPDMRGMTVCKHPSSDLIGRTLVLPPDDERLCGDCATKFIQIRR